MKSKTPELLKFKRLCRRLQESPRGVVGLLELLWLGTAKNCPRGDIGRFDNTDIAILCDWDGDPDELIAALVAERWLDENAEYRLIVHDWHEHAPSWVSMNLRRAGESFAAEPSIEATAEPTAERSTEATAEQSAEGTTLPSPSLPSPPPPPPPPPASGAAADASWEEAEEALRAEKVSRIRATVDGAQRRGLTPADARRIIGEYRAKPGAWAPGALVGRLTGELDEWPPPTDDWRTPADEKLAAERRRLESLRETLELRVGGRYRKLQGTEQRRLAIRARRRFPGLNDYHTRIAVMELLANQASEEAPA